MTEPREAAFTVASDHPSLAGHFPGNPIVPGVVLLDEACARLEIPVMQLRAVKFLAPVCPGDAVLALLAGPALVLSVAGKPCLKARLKAVRA